MTWCYEVEKITEPLLLGEGPHWNAETQLLYFIDITNSTIHLYDPLTKVHNYTYIGEKFSQTPVTLMRALMSKITVAQ